MMKSILKAKQPSREELLKVAASSLRLEGFEITAEELEKLTHEREKHGEHRQRRQAI